MTNKKTLTVCLVVAALVCGIVAGTVIPAVELIAICGEVDELQTFFGFIVFLS